MSKHLIESYMLLIENIQPTQLYISKSDYLDIRVENDDYEAIPIKVVGNYIFYVGNHALPLYLANRGDTEIRVVESDDLAIDMIACFTKVKWCKDNQIKSIKDLSIYMVEDKEYKKKWQKVCEKLSEQLYKNPLQHISFVKEVIAERKSEVCRMILQTLPKWFAIEKVVDNYCESVKAMEFVKIKIFDMVIGFLAYRVNYGMNCDLYILGIYEQLHRYGIGSLLIEHINGVVKANDVKYMSVKTLGENNHDKSYMKTRNFYIKNGFYPFEELTALWGEHNPCLLMIREVK